MYITLPCSNNYFNSKAQIGAVFTNGLQLTHYHLVNSLVKSINYLGLQAVGATLGMLLQEPLTLIKAAKYTFWDFKKSPTSYGFNSFPDNYNPSKKPILLLHGAAGSWNYLGDMATDLKNRGYPVFVLNVGIGGPTEEQRKKVQNKMETICQKFLDKGHLNASVDLVAHSMGANLALASAVSPDIPLVNGLVQKNTAMKPHSFIGKIITLANPSDKQDVDLMESIGKAQDLYNVIAKYDVLMGHKTPALTKSHLKEVDAKHINIVYHKEITSSILTYLSR